MGGLTLYAQCTPGWGATLWEGRERALCDVAVVWLAQLVGQKSSLPPPSQLAHAHNVMLTARCPPALAIRAHSSTSALSPVALARMRSSL